MSKFPVLPPKKKREAPNIIRHRGIPRKATTLDNTKVERKETFWVDDFSAFVKVRQYDNHFLYETDKVNSSYYMCTCGSPAVLVPPGPGGEFVCLTHQSAGVHQTGERPWV